MTVTAEILIPRQQAYNTARRMSGLSVANMTDKKWYMFLRSEHSPIRIATYRVYMQDIPYWVSVHFSRHKIGVGHFVTSCRTDRTGRSRAPDDLVNHEMVINAQALITIARKRLCMKASAETRLAMALIKQAIAFIDKPLSSVMMPDCTYRGKCNELKPCGKQGYVVQYYQEAEK
jgi:hypothetical protein